MTLTEAKRDVLRAQLELDAAQGAREWAARALDAAELRLVRAQHDLGSALAVAKAATAVFESGGES